MKRTVLIILLILFAISRAFSNSDKFLTTEVSLGTGISIYDASAGDLRKSILSGTDYKRIVTGLTVDTNLNISDPLKVMFGAEFFSDFLWDKINHYNTLDYAIFTGIKIFPNRTGLNFSISYVLGNRSDFYTEIVETPTEELNEDGTPVTKQTLTKKNSTKAWGNGFRLAIQYDFMQGKNYKVLPNVGAYYRCVPRGNYNTDHILCLYGGIRF